MQSEGHYDWPLGFRDERGLNRPTHDKPTGWQDHTSGSSSFTYVGLLLPLILPTPCTLNKIVYRTCKIIILTNLSIVDKGKLISY